MATLSLNTDCVMKWSEGESAFTALYVLRGITAGDTVDLSPHFRTVKRAMMMGITVAGTVTAVVSGSTSTIVTIPAGPALDGAILVAYGVHV
jgi:hypothetical protein